MIVDKETIVQVLGGGQGQNPARQAALGAGLPHTRSFLLLI